VWRRRDGVVVGGIFIRSSGSRLLVQSPLTWDGQVSRAFTDCGPVSFTFTERPRLARLHLTSYETTDADYETLKTHVQNIDGLNYRLLQVTSIVCEPSPSSFTEKP